MGRKSIAEIRRKEITEAFFTVVSEKGLAGATIREITEAAGLSQGMLHHYFANKEAMILEVMDYVITTYSAEFQNEIARFESATDRLRFFFSWFYDFERFDLMFSRAWIEFWVLSKTNEDISVALRNCYGTIKAILTDIIRDGIESNEFRKADPFATANLIVASLEGTTMLWVVDTENTPVETMGRQRAEMFVEYLAVKD